MNKETIAMQDAPPRRVKEPQTEEGTAAKMHPILSVRDLRIDFTGPDGPKRAVDGVSFDLAPGEVLAIVGESGSGKSVTVLSMLRLLPDPPARIVSGSVDLAGHGDILSLSEDRLQAVRGGAIGVIFQDPMTSLNPVLSVGFQIAEAIRLHRTVSREAAFGEAVALLEQVEIPNAAVRARQFPHEFSGGMRQRAMIAMAIANRPKVIVADEPTTALDVTVQAHTLEVLRAIQGESGAGLILITHDLGVVAEVADRVAVMYAGNLVETADVRSIFAAPRHPYTAGLLASRPSIDDPDGRLEPIGGQPPRLGAERKGCAFRPRCRLSRGRADCAERTPQLTPAGASHLSACHFSHEMTSRTGSI